MHWVFVRCITAETNGQKKSYTAWSCMALSWREVKKSVGIALLSKESDIKTESEKQTKYHRSGIERMKKKWFQTPFKLEEIFDSYLRYSDLTLCCARPLVGGLKKYQYKMGTRPLIRDCRASLYTGNINRSIDVYIERSFVIIGYLSKLQNWKISKNLCSWPSTTICFRGFSLFFFHNHRKKIRLVSLERSRRLTKKCCLRICNRIHVPTFRKWRLVNCKLKKRRSIGSHLRDTLKKSNSLMKLCIRFPFSILW